MKHCRFDIIGILIQRRERGLRWVSHDKALDFRLDLLLTFPDNMQNIPDGAKPQVLKGNLHMSLNEIT